MPAVARVWLAVELVALTVSATALAQESKSVALAKQLSAALDAAKLDSIATKDPAKPDVFSPRCIFGHTTPGRLGADIRRLCALNETLAKKNARGVPGSEQRSVPASKVFIEDLGANGLVAKPKDNEPFDTYEVDREADRVRRRLEEAATVRRRLHEGVCSRRRKI